MGELSIIPLIESMFSLGKKNRWANSGGDEAKLWGKNNGASIILFCFELFDLIW